MSGHSSELERIKAEYGRRDAGADGRTYDPLNPAYLYVRHQIERHAASLIRSFVSPTGSSEGLSRMKVLDVGSGSGAFLEMFAQLGFKRSRVFGADLLPRRLEEARENFSAENIACADAAHLPFADGSFGLVSQFTVFSSILSGELRRRVASEMKRVAAPGGHILWYDMIVTNPFNRNLRGVGYKEMASLFGARPLAAGRVVLNPWILRPLLKISPALCDMLAGLRFLNAFYMALFRVEK